MSLLITTDDIETFSGKSVDLEVEPNQNIVDQASTLLIKLEFQASSAGANTTQSPLGENEFGFDYAQLVVPAIICTKVGDVWKIQLPEVLGDSSATV